jgi:hypothetical protein
MPDHDILGGAATFEQWAFERGLIDTLLNQCEQNERAILLEFGCPTDPIAIYDILIGKRPAPWSGRRAKCAKKDQQRAVVAMHALVYINKTRQHLELGHENPRLAAHAALIAGALSSTVARDAILRRQTGTAAKRRGDQIAAEAEKHDAAIRRLATVYTSDEGTSKAAAWIARQLKTKLKKQKKKPVTKSPRTIRRRLAVRP